MPIKITAFLGVILLVMGIFCGCSPGDDYISGLDDKLIQAEITEDNALVKNMRDVAKSWALDQSLQGGDIDTLSWDSLKEHLDPKSVSYLESLGEESFSDRTLAASIRDRGWIKVRQGWILISKEDELDFSYSKDSPDS